MLLRDGAMVARYFGDPAAAGATFLRGCQAVIGRVTHPPAGPARPA